MCDQDQKQQSSTREKHAHASKNYRDNYRALSAGIAQPRNSSTTNAYTATAAAKFTRGRGVCFDKSGRERNRRFPPHC
jgi:hypothetical protein